MTSSSKPHQIRLAGPWEFEIPKRGQHEATSQKIKLPFGCSDESESRRMTRPFNGTDGMMAAAGVLVQIDFHGDAPKCEINSQKLTEEPTESNADGQRTFEITSHLKRHNLLALNLSEASEIIDVRLLIFEE